MWPRRGCKTRQSNRCHHRRLKLRPKGGGRGISQCVAATHTHTHFSLSISLSEIQQITLPPRMERNVSLCASAVVVQTEKTMEEGERSQPAEKNANEVFLSTTFLMVRFWDYVGGGPLNLIQAGVDQRCRCPKTKKATQLGVYTLNFGSHLPFSHLLNKLRSVLKPMRSRQKKSSLRSHVL